MKKSLITFALTLIMVFGLLSLVGCKGKNNNIENTGAYVTRGQWIAMLSDSFGLDTYNSSAPYYSDISDTHSLFSPVQASAERGVLAIYDNDKLDVDKPVTHDEVASSAAIAAGFKPNEQSEFGIDASINYAIEYGIISKAGNEPITEDECESIIEAAQNLYLANPGEEKVVVEYADNLVDLREMTNHFTFKNESELSFPASLVTANRAMININGQERQINTGDSILTPATEEHPVGAAYKIVSMREEDGQVFFSVTAPSFGDIYDYADIHTTVSLSDNSIIWADGIKVSPVSIDETSTDKYSYHIQLLSDRESSGFHMQPDKNDFSRKWNVKFNTGIHQIYQDALPAFLGNGPEAQALEASNFVYNMTPSLADFNGSLQAWTKELEKTDKYEDGYDITVDVDIQLAANVDVTYQKSHILGIELDLWPESASMVLHSNVTLDFSMEGSIGEDKKFELGIVTIPIGQTGLTINGNLFLYLEATGKVEIKIEMENTQRTGWNVEEGYQCYQSPVRKRPGQWGNTSSAEVLGVVDLSMGVGLEVALSSFSTVKLIGVDWKIGGDLEAKGTVTGECTEQTTDGIISRHYTETIKLGSTFYIPISTITVSGPDKLSDILGLEKSWEIARKEDAAQIPFKAAEWVIWEATSTVGPDGETVETISQDIEAGKENLSNFDFQGFAGTYSMYSHPSFNGYSDYYPTSFTLDENGMITGENITSAVPIYITENSNGTLTCMISEGEQYFDEEAGTMFTTKPREFYVICPVGITSGFDDYPDYDELGTDIVRIRYIIIGGGIVDIMYYKN